MVSRVSTTTLLGIDAAPVEVETQIYGSLRRFTIVGLPDGVVRESKDRVRCAIENSGFSFPNHEVIVSLAPASMPKIGAGFDLAIALSILAADGQLPRNAVANRVFLGELALDGRVREVPGTLAGACMVGGKSRQEFFCSRSSAHIAAEVNRLSVYGVSSLFETSQILSGAIKPEKVSPYSDLNVEKEEEGFNDVIGQEEAKRALLIAAAGGHNVLMIGPPGGGKSMLASRLPNLLPNLSSSEKLEVSKIYDALRSSPHTRKKQRVAGLVQERPFRSPHHSTSMAGLVGGGTLPLPGEISLAHRGVLFLDELPEFRRGALEALREPLETNEINICRAKQAVTYPADFILVAAMNPPEEKMFSSGQSGNSSRREMFSKISSPLLDRIDLQLWVPSTPPQELLADRSGEKEERLREKVTIARDRQADRLGSYERTNSNLTSKELKSLINLSTNAQRILEKGSEKFSLSARGYTRVLKVARTIADLELSNEIEAPHMYEALSYRLSA